MDLKCPVCGEPWDNESLHDRAEEQGAGYKLIASLFRKSGCKALGERHNGNEGSFDGSSLLAVYELSGDDVDGAMSDIEDFGL